MNEIAFFLIIANFFAYDVIVGLVFLKSKEKQKENETDWEQVRKNAAIEALPECLRTCNEALMRGGRLECNSISEQAAKMAVDYADALVKHLKETEE